jgi:uncharacterized protein with HEPN domain
LMSRRDWTLFVADMLEACDGLRNRIVHEYFGLLKRIQNIPTALHPACTP